MSNVLFSLAALWPVLLGLALIFGSGYLVAFVLHAAEADR